MNENQLLETEVLTTRAKAERCHTILMAKQLLGKN